MSRKRVLAGVAATLTITLGLAACGSGGGIEGGGAEGGGGGGSAETVFRLAFNQTEEHPQYKAAMQMGEDLYEATDGRYGIEVYANELLGTQSDVVNNVSEGSVEMMLIGGPLMESFNPDFVVFNLPYMFASQEAQAAVFADTAATGELFASIEESKNITVVAGLFAGVRNVYNNERPVRTPEDLAGLRLRVQQSDSQVAMIEAMGGVASPMGQGEVYTALQSGVLEGAENNETVYNSLKHDEVAKYYSYTEHLMIPDYLLMNTDVLAQMSEEDRAAFTELVPALVEDANTGFFEFIETSRAASEENGAEFNEDVDVEAFRQRVAPLVEESIDNDVKQGLYDAVQQYNEQYPAES
ncbi:TRAP transporter substrate-binding protein [Auraticoccus monumenti]|uniref:Tripartite ATP-independent transporter solute receptor, DctP family n=1 Tax=Auraticoccus monumenti TaxID=675864 RepID=A0A1G7DZB3_9ACTN|nr:TRAP transporter substrate-binding protein [Auraticoccus monumenti]SDE56797.1 tripartite ATP-independent transporter solute receptor, DctP family [Auraticoccus monumenti]